jgi:arsenite methyltransferase
MAEDLLVDPEALRDQVRDKYREVAVEPHRTFHFHIGRSLAARLGYDTAAVDALPDRAVQSFAGVGNPFSLRRLESGERVVDVGSGERRLRRSATAACSSAKDSPRPCRWRTGRPTP